MMSMRLYEITTFYRNYHSSRYVNGQLVLRMRHAGSAEMLASYGEFADFSQGDITLDPLHSDDATEVPSFHASAGSTG